MVILTLLARHFKDADFIERCPLEMAVQDQIGVIAHEGIDDITICLTDGLKTYKHETYGTQKFERDKLKAASHNFDDTIIRQLELYEA